MKKLSFILAFIALTPSAALAQMKGYLGTDGYFHIQGLQANKSYSVNLGGMPLIKSGISNSCGILRIAASGTIKASDRIEIKDEKSGNTYGFTNTSIPVKETAKCDGTVKSKREIWKDEKGTTYISGLSPSSAQTIRLLTSAPTRNIKANICGFLSLKLGDPRPGAIIIENQAFVLASAQSSGGIACRKGKLYVAYPNPVLVAAVSAVTWRSQNPISFSSNTQIASISGGSTSWSPPPNNPNPNPGPGDACTVGVNCNPPPPPPPTCPEGYSGTPPNCQAPSPPLPPPPPPPPPPTCPEGTTGTPPNCEAPKPTPVSGKMCKYAGTLVVIGLPPNKNLVAYASERGAYNDRFTSSDSGGWAQFDNFNFNAKYEGDPASVGIQYKKDNGDWENVEDYPGYSGFPNFVYIPSIAPCKSN